MRGSAGAWMAAACTLACACASGPSAPLHASAAKGATSTPTSWPPSALADPPPACAPEDFDGFEDGDGCLDADNDKDGIPDRADKCPNAPETYNGYEDEDGCPDKPVCGAGGPQEILFLDKIQFAKGSSKVGADATELLHAVAQTMAGHPEFLLLEIEGFTDDEGSLATSLALSTARAHAVIDELVAHGVAKDRLRAKGYGPYCRLDETSHEKNRRVEIKIAAVTPDSSIPNELGCADATAHGVAPDPVP